MKTIFLFKHTEFSTGINVKQIKQGKDVLFQQNLCTYYIFLYTNKMWYQNVTRVVLKNVHKNIVSKTKSLTNI